MENTLSINRKIAWLIFGLAIVVSSSLAANEASTLAPWGATAGGESIMERPISGNGFKKVVVLKAEGIIADTASTSPFSGESGVSATQLVKQIKHAKSDPEVEGIILDINSPGGTTAASQMIAEALREFRTSGKHIVAQMGEVAASGGYYIAAEGNTIVANPSTLTGSIGVIMEMANYEELYKKVGYEPIVYKAGKYKDIGSPNRDATPEEQAILQGLVDEEYDAFIKSVATGRKMDEAKVRELAEGKIYTGRQAKEVGLVDELGNFDASVSAIKKLTGEDDPRIVEYYQPFSFLDSFMGVKLAGSTLDSLLNALNPAATQPTTGLSYLWKPNL